MSALVCESISRNALPVCLFRENPHRLVSELEMLEFQAHHFVAISSTLGQAIMDIGAGKVPRDHTMRAVMENCALLLQHCEALGLEFSASQIKRFRESIQPGIRYTDIRASLIDIQQRVWDEMEQRKFLALSREDDKYFTGEFPSAVLERFPEIGFDADEAGKCLALERPTACVYHLMRVTEYALQAIGKQLGIRDERPNWEPIITKIDAELKKPYKERQYKGMSDFLAHVSAHINAVKVAWRNRVMHVERKHTPEEAREIYRATVGLMRYTAESLPSDKAGIVQSIRDIIKK